MSDKEINVAIAEACGWTEVTDNRKFHQCPTGFPPNSEGTFAYVSDYCGDLNAMHKAEETLTKQQQEEYDYQLSEITAPITGERWSLLHATARHRAEAFLRTIGKWKEEA